MFGSRVLVLSATASLIWLALLVGCARPATDQATLIAVRTECQPLLKLRLIDGLVYPTVPQSRWPRTIAGLKPESVTVLREGVMIEVGSFSAEGWGYFVPRDGKHRPKANDPKYTNLGQGVYWYRMD